MNEQEPVSAFSAKSLAFTWLGMSFFGSVNFFVFGFAWPYAGVIAGSMYLVASIIVAAIAYAAKWRAFAAGITLGFTIMTLVDGTCTLWTPTEYGAFSGLNGAIFYIGALVIFGLVMVVWALVLALSGSIRRR